MESAERVRLHKKPTRGRFCWFSSFAAVALTSLCCAAPASAAGGSGETEATQRLCAAGPAAALAKAERLRGEAEVRAAGVLPNPSVVAEHQRSLRGLDEHETIVGVSVPLGLGGRRFLLQDAATARREQARADAESIVFESALAFRAVYARAVADQARAEVLGEQQTALDDLSATVQGLTKGGEAAGYDLLRQRAQATHHRGSLDAARGRALASRALLEAWAEGVATLSPERGALPTEPHPRSEATTPALRSLEASAKASSAEATAARRRWVPDLDVFAGYREVSAGNDTGHGVSLGLTLPLTFFDHGQGEAARADAERELALARASTLRREQRATLKAARLRLTALGTALAATEQASTDARVIQAKAKQLYAAGEATLTELLDAFRLAEDARLARIDVLEEIAHTRLALMRAAGTMFDPKLDAACRNQRGAP
jgi:cobalt-zinc-cadmium efflux system outer membrane protein